MTFLWNNPVALSSKPKGARKQAADDRLKRYQKLFLEAANTVAFESGGSAVVVPLNKVARKAARRARQREEMLQAASSLLQDAAPGAGRTDGEEASKAMITSIGGVSAIFSRSKLAVPKSEEAPAEAAAAAAPAPAPTDQTLLNAHLQAALAQVLAAQGPLATVGLTGLLGNPTAVDLLQQQQKVVQLQLAQAQAAQLQLQLQAQQLLQAQQAAVAAAAAAEAPSDSPLRPASSAEAHQLLALSQPTC